MKIYLIYHKPNKGSNLYSALIEEVSNKTKQRPETTMNETENRLRVNRTRHNGNLKWLYEGNTRGGGGWEN